MKKLHFLYTATFANSDLRRFMEANRSESGGGPEEANFSTMLALRDEGYSVEAVTEWPRSGIVFAHPRALPKQRPPHYADLFIICWQHDHMRCDYANLHIVMNRFMTTRQALSVWDRVFWPGPSVVLHFLPELSLKPRDSAREDRFENIAYLGAPKNLKPEFQCQAWHDALHEIGARFVIKDAYDDRSDYRDVDCVLAIRPSDQQIHQKPPTKLWNAWRAGVPAILGNEPGFRDYRISDLDYLEAETADQALDAIIRLRDNPKIRSAMIENGRGRIQECSVETLIGQWRAFLDGPLETLTAEWFEGPAWKRRAFGGVRAVRMGLRSARSAMRRLFGNC